jgi:hypothetical protein
MEWTAAMFAMGACYQLYFFIQQQKARHSEIVSRLERVEGLLESRK